MRLVSQLGATSVGRAQSLRGSPAALRRVLVVGGASFLVAASLLRIQQVRLNDSLAHGFRGHISAQALSPDGSRVVYTADVLTEQVYELFVSPSDGSGGALRLNPDLVAGGDVQSFALTPDGSRVVYRADQETDGTVELYSVPIDGSLAPLKLNGSLTTAVGLSQFSPDGSWAILMADDAKGRSELYSVPSDGSLPPVKLNGPLVADGFVRYDRIYVSPDSSRVVYQACEDSASELELYSVPIDGGTSVKLNGTLVAQGNVEFAQIGAESGWVAYTADQITDNVIELFGVPIAGGTAVRLNGTLPAGSTLQSFSLVSAQGVPQVVYRADQDVLGRTELYAVPADGSQAPLRLNAPFASGAGVAIHSITPDQTRVVYLTHAGEVYSAPVDGSQGAVLLNSALPSGVVVHDFRVNQDGTRVVYWTDDTNGSGDSTDLYSAPSDGSASAVLLSDALRGNRVAYSPTLSPDGTHLVYVRQTGLDSGLYAVPLDGSLAPVKVNGALPSNSLYPQHFAFDASSAGVLFSSWTTPGIEQIYRAPIDASSTPLLVSDPGAAIGEVTGFQLSADRTRVLFTARHVLDSLIELYSFPSGGQTAAVRVNDPLPATPWQGDVLEFVLPGAAELAAYTAPQDVYGLTQLYATRTDGGAGSQRLDDELGTVSGLRATPDGLSVVYLFRSSFALPFDQTRRFRLAVLDGSQPPAELPGSYWGIADQQIGPEGTRVLFRMVNAYNDAQLHSLPLDGSGPAVLLDDVDVAFDFQLSPDGGRAVYRRGPDIVSDGPLELRSVPSDGSGAPIVLNGPLPTEGNVTSFGLTPGGERVVFRADQDVDERFELYSVPADGSGPVVRLNATLVANGDVSILAVASAGPYVVYRADQEVDERDELYRVPNDGSTPPVKLNPALVAGGDVGSAGISPDGTRVVYSADQTTNDVVELHSAPLDGSATGVRISAPMVTGGDAGTYQIAPDSSRVVYVADQAVNEVLELFSVPITGGAVVRLSSPMVSGGDVSTVVVSADARWVVYLADQRVDGVNELFRARIDGSGTVERLSGPLVQGGSVGGTTPSFRVGADGQTVVFTADKLHDGVVELFSSIPYPARARIR